MSDTPDKTGGWVPSADEPSPPTTEFQAIRPDGVEPIDGPAGPDETDADAGAASRPVADAGDPDAPSPGSPDALLGGTAATSTAAAGAAGAPPAVDPPAWKTPAAAGLPPQWGDPAAQDGDDDASDGPQPTGDVSNLWGLVPEDRPEVALGAALAAGALTAILLRTLARR